MDNNNGAEWCRHMMCLLLLLKLILFLLLLLRWYCTYPIF